MYNMTNVTSANTILDMFTAVNELSNGAMFAIVLLGLFIMIFMVFKKYDTKAVLLLDSFAVTLIAIPMWTFGWIGWSIMIVPIILFFASIIMWFFIE